MTRDRRSCGPVVLWSLLLLLSPAWSVIAAAQGAPLIVDHGWTNLSAIPVAWIQKAKTDLHIAYGHTSHGSQITTGMTGLVSFKGSLYAWNNGGTGGALDLRDSPFSGASDLGNPNRTAWATATRNYLNAHPEVNVIIWSWCGQADGTVADINTYLSLMTGIENDYPGVMFVYMTGHLNGTGATGNLNLRNEQIRNYCRTNNKILYDFADIESYDPDGLVHYMPLLANDACDYDSDGNGSRDRNWAIVWQNSHVLGVDWYNCSSAHSQPLNANRKAYAAWSLWAALAGWTGPNPPAVSIADAAASEGNFGTTNAFVTASLSKAVRGAVTVAYATANGTAAAGSDYVATTGTLTFPSGATSRSVTVQVMGDLVDEPNETFFVNLSQPSNATLSDSQSQATIQDNDPTPQVFMEDCAVQEGDASATPCALHLTLSGASSTAVTVSYATAAGTAQAGTDFTSTSGSVSFAPLSVGPATVNVSVLGDTNLENNETFALNLSNASGAILPDPPGTGTIIDDDAPSLSGIELDHGAFQLWSLGPPTPGEDLFRIAQHPRSSYEVVVDATSGDIGPVVVERLAADNSTVAQTAAPVGTGRSMSMRWQNPLAQTLINQHLRVRSAECSSSCGADDVYRIGVYDTTYRIPRFNNSGTQLTVMVLQNPSSASVSGSAYFWSTIGNLLYVHPFTLAARSLLTLNTTGVPALQGRSGSITVAHDAAYGALAGKTVALEAATGFSFDSTMEPRR